VQLYKILSILLCYPEQDLLDNLAIIRSYLEADSLAELNELLTYLATKDLISLQEHYVQSFDRTPSQSLHLFEHIHGEDRIRGQAMVDLMNEYQTAGFELVCEELPDYLPLFLEFLAVCDPSKAQEFLGEAIDVINHIGQKLQQNNSTYAGIFKVLVRLSPVEPKPLTVPPVRDMDEAMEKFGPNPEGIEPLLSTRVVGSINHHATNTCPTNSCTQCTTDSERELR